MTNTTLTLSFSVDSGHHIIKAYPSRTFNDLKDVQQPLSCTNKTLELLILHLIPNAVKFPSPFPQVNWISSPTVASWTP